MDKKEIIISVCAGVTVGTYKLYKILKKRKSKCHNCGLCRHKLFDILDSFIANMDNPKWKCVNEYKTLIAKDMIRTKFNIGKKRLKEFVCRSCNSEKDSSNLVTEYDETIESIIEEYTNMWKAMSINQIIIDRLNYYHSFNARYALELGRAELKKDYNDTKASLYHLLDSLIIPYSIFISEIRDEMDSFNGQLANDEYKSVKNTGECVKSYTIEMKRSREHG